METLLWRRGQDLYVGAPRDRGVYEEARERPVGASERPARVLKELWDYTGPQFGRNPPDEEEPSEQGIIRAK